MKFVNTGLILAYFVIFIAFFAEINVLLLFYTVNGKIIEIVLK